MRGRSAAGERAVGQRSHYRCQRPGVCERQVTVVQIHQAVADDDWAAVKIAHAAVEQHGLKLAARSQTLMRVVGRNGSRHVLLRHGLVHVCDRLARKAIRAKIFQGLSCDGSSGTGRLPKSSGFQIDTRAAGYTAGRLSRAREAPAFIS